MSLLFINEENLPHVDAFIVTRKDQPTEYPTITVEDIDPDFDLDLSSTVREVTAFFTQALTEATLRGYQTVATRFPDVRSRRGITWLLRVNIMRIVSRFDVDVYIIVTDRQRQMMRRAIDIDDLLYPKMFSCRISADYAPPTPKKPRKRGPIEGPRYTPEEESDACYGAEESDSCYSAEESYACYSMDDVSPSYMERSRYCKRENSSLSGFIRDMDDTFAVRLLKLIDRRNMTEVECYKAANVSRQTWYKIMNDGEYRPSKTTVISFAIALKLDYEETQALLATAGYTLSRSILFDKIIVYCIENKIYDVFEINAMLYSYDQECLGA